MKFDFEKVKEIMKENPSVLIVKVKNIDEHLFLLHGFGIYDDDDTSPFTYPFYLYIRKNPWVGYNRSYDREDVYNGEEKDMFGNKIIRKQIISDFFTPKKILLNAINECKLGYAACVVVDDGEHYLAIDDNTLVGDYGYINIDGDLDDELNLLGSNGEPNGERIVKIYTAKIVALDNWVGKNTVWEYDDKDDELAKYCNEHNITPEDLVKYFGMKIDGINC
jgi:hypothetical protein